MDIRKWISSTGIYDDAASWDSGIPDGSTEAAVFTGTSQVSCIGDPGPMIVGRIVTRPAYRGDIGAPGNPLLLEINSPNQDGQKAVFRGRGNVYFKGDTGNYADVVVDTDTLDTVASLDGAMRHVFVKSGNVVFPSTVLAITSLRVYGSLSRVTILGDGGAVGKLRILAGTVDSKEDSWSTIHMTGGRLIQRGLLRDSCDVTMYGGWLEYATTADVSTHNPNLYLHGGTFDCRELSGDLTAGDLVIGPDVKILGNVLGQGNPGGLGIVIDLQEDYP